MRARHPISTAALILAVLAVMALGGPSYATSVVKRAVNAAKVERGLSTLQRDALDGALRSHVVLNEADSTLKK